MEFDKGRELCEHTRRLNEKCDFSKLSTYERSWLGSVKLLKLRAVI